MIGSPWKIAAVVLLSLVLLLAGYLVSALSQRNDARRERDAAVATAADLRTTLAVCRSNVAGLAEAVAEQGEAVLRAQEQGASEQEAGRQALEAVQQRNADLVESVGVLRRLLASGAAPTTCEGGWDAFRSAVSGK